MTQTILLIAGNYQPQHCGTAHYTAHLRLELAKKEVKSIVLTTHNSAQIFNDSQIKGVVKNWGLSQLLPLIKAILSTPADLLHIQHAAGTYRFQRPIFLLPFLLRRCGYQKPIITTVHEYGWWEWQPKGIPTQWLEWLKNSGQKRGWWDREDGFLLTGSNAIITTNPDAEKAIIERLPNAKNRLYRIPIAANLEKYPIERQPARQQLLQHYNWAENSLIFVFFGFLHPVKGIEYLLSAFQIILVEEPQVKLLLLGGVESLALQGEDAQNYWDKLEHKINSLNLNEAVKMTGYLPNETASRYLSGADIGILPFNHGVTLKSGSFLALLAHHLPVIATLCPSPDPDLIKEDIAEWVSPRDSIRLSEIMLKLVREPQRQEQLVKNGDRFIQQFTWSNIAEKHLNLYQKVINRN